MTPLADRLRSQPFELILSSGFFGFFAHTGVVRALEEAGLDPVAVGGSSAGALVAGLWGAGLGAEAIRDRLFALRRSDFWDPDPAFGLLPSFTPGLLRGGRMEALLREALAPLRVARFADCRRPVRLVAHDVRARRPVVLRDGELPSAIRASCAVPGMFQPVRIDGRIYIDGGVTDRAGISAASEGACVLYHHLPAHSPWRRIARAQNRPPAWARMHVLSEPQLPRLSPFHLHRGPAAYAIAREMALRALESPAADL
jgi:NTE family protein